MCGGAHEAEREREREEKEEKEGGREAETNSVRAPARKQLGNRHSFRLATDTHSAHVLPHAPTRTHTRAPHMTGTQERVNGHRMGEQTHLAQCAFVRALSHTRTHTVARMQDRGARGADLQQAHFRAWLAGPACLVSPSDLACAQASGLRGRAMENQRRGMGVGQEGERGGAGWLPSETDARTHTPKASTSTRAHACVRWHTLTSPCDQVWRAQWSVPGAAAPV